MPLPQFVHCSIAVVDLLDVAPQSNFRIFDTGECGEFSERFEVQFIFRIHHDQPIGK